MFFLNEKTCQLYFYSSTHVFPTAASRCDSRKLCFQGMRHSSSCVRLHRRASERGWDERERGGKGEKVSAASTSGNDFSSLGSPSGDGVERRKSSRSLYLSLCLSISISLCLLCRPLGERRCAFCTPDTVFLTRQRRDEA